MLIIGILLFTPLTVASYFVAVIAMFFLPIVVGSILSLFFVVKHWVGKVKS